MSNFSNKPLSITKCAIYARFSSHLQKETSIEDQIAECRKYATKNNLDILANHIYIDRALSGTSIGPRSSLQELIKTTISGNALFNCVLIYDTSRLARNTREVLQIVEEFSMMNIQCHFVSQNFNSGEESSPEILAMHGMFDALYSRELAKKVRRGMIGQINRGYYVGSRLFGYTSVPIHTHKKDAHGNFEVEGYRLEINPTEAKIVKLVFKLFAEKEWSAKKIANYLNTKMINNKWPPPTYSTYSTYWTYNTISGSKKNYFGILNKELYIGEYIWNRRSYKKNPKTGRYKMSFNPREMWISVLKPELRIISDELWQKAKNRQRYIEAKSEGKYTRAKVLYSENLLSRICVCGECGGNFVILIGGKYQYSKYGCSNNWKMGVSRCNNEGRINKAFLEKIIIKIISEVYSSNAFMVPIKEELDKVFTHYILDNIITPEKSALKKELESIDIEINNISLAIRQGVITQTTKKMLVDAERNKQETMDKIIKISSKDVIGVQDLVKSCDISDYFNKEIEKLQSARTVSKCLYSIVDKIIFHRNKQKAIMRVQEEMTAEIHENVDNSFIYFVNLVNSRHPRIRLQLGPQLIPYTKSITRVKFTFIKHPKRQSENTGDYQLLSLSRRKT